ncbi:hypothetical protein BN135_2427 [Cronobacter muytjensii 530]
MSGEMAFRNAEPAVYDYLYGLHKCITSKTPTLMMGVPR